MFEEKLELTPIDFPRFWLPKTDAEELFGDMTLLARGGNAPHAMVTSEIDWRDVVTENVYCLIPGQR